MNRLWLLILLLPALNACGHQSKKDAPAAPAAQIYGSAGYNAKAIASIKTYDHYNQETGVATGFFIDKNLLVANLNDIKGCFKAKVAALGSEEYSDVEGYLAFDHKTNLVLLRTFVRTKTPVKVYPQVSLGDSCYLPFRKEGKLFSKKLFKQAPATIDSVSVYPTLADTEGGYPVFNYNHQLSGIVQTREVNGASVKAIVPVQYIEQLRAKAGAELGSVFDLSTKSSKAYPSYKTIGSFNIVTSMGHIRIKLYNETPEYRDNFIRLVSDGFYDSLLVHRVLKGFLIQTGAADSRHAKRDDVVGWQGPGYTLPVIKNPKLYHKRGAVAASKLPADRNPRNRCDGSQFYIVSGRVFSHAELDDMEKKDGKKFTPEQRTAYTTVGGAPYLDGDYTVFGEVAAGMEVVDKIANVETYNVDRPLKDIRVWRIEMLKN